MPISPEMKIRYEFDKSGRNPNNLVSEEGHVLNDREVRIISPRHAHFYIESVVIKDKKNNQVVPRASYFFDDTSETIAGLTGLGAASTIVLVDKTVSKNISVTYQAVGGQFTSIDIPALQNKLNSLNLDNRPVSWLNIANKPDAFPPAEHLHPIWQTYGYEGLIYVIERLIKATLIGDEESHNVIWEAIGGFDAKLEKLKNKVDVDVANLIGDNNNGITAKLEELKRQINNDILNKVRGLQTSLDNHINARGNVHGLTLENIKQLGVYSKPEIDERVQTLNGSINTLKGAVYTKQQVDAFLPPIRDSITQLEGVVNADKRNLADNYYNKQNVDTKDTAVKDFAWSNKAIMENIVSKMLFGKYTQPGKQITRENGTKANLAEDEINTEMRRVFGNTPKLAKDIIPISTAANNQLRWNGDGLYYGNVPDDIFANVYVDPDAGLDEPITFENKRGTKEKPLATIGYALAQGPSEVRRTIYLKEGKTHVIGKRLVSVTGTTATYESNPVNHRDDNDVYFRGGNIEFLPYGTRTDEIYAKARAIRARFGDYANGTEERQQEIIDLGCKIEFRGAYVGNNITRGGKSYPAFNRYCVSIANNTTLSFSGLTISYTTDPVADAKVKADEFVYSSTNIFGWWNTFTINFVSCAFSTGERAAYDNKGGKMTINMFSPSVTAQTFAFDNCWMTKRFYTGENNVIEFGNSTNSAIKFNRLDRDIVGMPTFVPGKTYYTGFKIKSGIFYNVKTNIEPTQEEELNTNKAGAPSGTRPAEIEVLGDKVFAVYHDGNTIQRIQVSPARWAG